MPGACQVRSEVLELAGEVLVDERTFITCGARVALPLRRLCQ
jgi:hypothetical protein